MVTPKHVLFALAFTALVLVGSQYLVFPLLGVENQSFTIFQFFGPSAGAFLGPILGGALAFAAAAVTLVAGGKEITFFSVLRLFPMVLAALYFGTKAKDQRLVALVPIAAMLAFWAHPVGQQAWFYALYWLIPIIATLKPGLVSRSLGATFTAHAVGSVAFLYALPSTPALWIGLIPIVAFERGLFTIGIATSYMIFNTAMAKLELPFFNTDPRYVLFARKAHAK